MHLIDTDADYAETLIGVLASHLPTGVGLGRVRIATEDKVLADYDDTAALWTLDGDPDDGCVRQLELGGGRYEVTRWVDGVEVDRHIIDSGYGVAS